MQFSDYQSSPKINDRYEIPEDIDIISNSITPHSKTVDLDALNKREIYNEEMKKM